MSEKLLPCPMCGSPGFLHAIEPHTHGPLAWFMPDHTGSAYVECTGCTVALSAGNEADAIAAWNRRQSMVLRASEAAGFNAAVEAARAVFARPYTWKSFNSTTNGNPLEIDGCREFVTRAEHERVLRMLQDAIGALSIPSPPSVDAMVARRCTNTPCGKSGGATP